MTAQELLYDVLPRLSEPAGVDFLQAVNAALRSIGKHLANRRSDLSKSLVTLDYFAGEDAIALPAEILGFCENPVAGTVTLTPLATGEREGLTRSGDPRRFELIGSSLYIFPCPATAGTVRGMAFCLPKPVLDLNKTLPWHRLFDDLLRESVHKILSKGLDYVATAEFEALVTKEVDALLSLRSPRPKRARGVHF